MNDPGFLPRHIQRNIALDDHDGCWTWIRSTHQGYATTTVFGKRWLAHRYSYSLYVGAIPKGLVIDHLCRNRRCINPAHLEPVSIAENVQRGARATQTHCKRGHEFTPENTDYYRPTVGGGISRKCLACRRERWSEAAAANGRTVRRSIYTEDTP